MINSEAELEHFEEQLRIVFKAAKRQSPASLDEKIMAMAKRAVEKKKQRSRVTPLFRGDYVLMAAADDDDSGAAVLTDESSRTVFSASAIRGEGEQRTYMYDVEPMDEDDETIEKYIGHPFTLFADGEAICSGIVDDDTISVNVQLNDDMTTPSQWRFEIYAKEDS